MTTFAQLGAKVKNFLRGWLLVLGLKEGLVECATVCVKSVVILLYFPRDTLIAEQSNYKRHELFTPAISQKISDKKFQCISPKINGLNHRELKLDGAIGHLAEPH